MSRNAAPDNSVDTGYPEPDKDVEKSDTLFTKI
ncbi:hypothetical protein CGLO_10101 [Colletotrichum gloeosporioides Cg-14]|uniref:Uncharacterized protein n=1 Tax=Colletotrichum gloeosporioides (strain Cg-14) TaxID=1237896 RepID=T0LFW6_COLGC|nr:hypothetical protein CGLO_10101 [Colletotrichum gloeosporioides Cg-14]